MKGLHYMADDLGESRDYHGYTAYGDPFAWVGQVIDQLEQEIAGHLAPRAAFADFLHEQGIE